MIKLSILRMAVASAAFVLLSGNPGHAAPRKTLQAFANEQEITDLFKLWAAERRDRLERQRSANQPAPAAPLSGMADMMAAPAAKAEAGLAKEQDSITNVQHAGVDEGGIVKRHGDYLVILRRGRLFTVKVGDNDLAPVSVADAFGSGIDPRGAWYDEMLISGSTIAVIGYSYARGGTEIGLFDISRAGRLAYRATWHLRSNDYYSSRNYASRLIGSKLVFYTPLHLNPWGGDPWGSFPAMRRWRSGATTAECRRIAPATRIYRTDEEIDPNQGVGAPYRDGVRSRAAGAGLREHRRARRAGAGVLRVGRLGLRVDDAMAAGYVPRGRRRRPRRSSAYRSTAPRLPRSRSRGARSTSSPSSRARTVISTCWSARRAAARACGPRRPMPAISRCCALRSTASPTAGTRARGKLQAPAPAGRPRDPVALHRLLPALRRGRRLEPRAAHAALARLSPCATRATQRRRTSRSRTAWTASRRWARTPW